MYGILILILCLIIVFYVHRCYILSGLLKEVLSLNDRLLQVNEAMCPSHVKEEKKNVFNEIEN